MKMTCVFPLLLLAQSAALAQPINSNQNDEGVIEATLLPGADIGAKINAAYAALPANGGQITVHVPVGGFRFSTPIVIGTAGKPATITCSANAGAEQSNGVLTFLPSSGRSITFNVATSSTTPAVPRGYGLRGCFLQVSHGTSVGLFLGGGNGGEGFSDESSTINGFGTDVETGENTFFVRFHGTYIGQDTTGVLVNIPNANNSGEEIIFDGVIFHEGGAGAVNIEGAQVTMNGVSFDNAQLVAASAYVSCMSCHFENPDSAISYPFVLSSGNTSLINAQILDDYRSTGTATSAILATGGTLVISGLDGVFQNPSYTSVIAVRGSANVFESDPAALNNTAPAIGGSTTGRYIVQNDPRCYNSGNPASCPTYLSNLPISANNGFLAGAPDGAYQMGGHLEFAGTRMQSTPDNKGYFTGKYLVASDTTDGCNGYASELDFYTENKSTPDTRDTSLVAGKVDCFGNLHIRSVIPSLSAPRTSSSPCFKGQTAEDSAYGYVCVAENTWKRYALSTF